MNHAEKVKLARKLLSKRELKLHRPLFSSLAWDQRKESIEARVARTIVKVKARVASKKAKNIK